MYKSIFLVLLFTGLLLNLSAQNSMYGTRSDYFLSPANGAPFRFNPNDEVAGSPLLYDEWKTGSVILANNEKYDNVQLKFDAYRSKFLYNQHDTLYELLSEVSQIRLKDPYFSNDTSHDIVLENINQVIMSLMVMYRNFAGVRYQ